MSDIRYVKQEDKEFWFGLDKHLSEEEFENKVRDKMGYVLLRDGVITAVLRYNLFWDSIPFCTMLFVDSKYQHSGCGSELMEYWERDMKARGHEMVMTSTQSDESAQHFYRKLGYIDAGSLVINITKFMQPMELFFIKAI